MTGIKNFSQFKKRNSSGLNGLKLVGECQQAKELSNSLNITFNIQSINIPILNLFEVFQLSHTSFDN